MSRYMLPASIAGGFHWTFKSIIMQRSLFALLIFVFLGCQPADPSGESVTMADTVSVNRVSETPPTQEDLLTGKVWGRTDSTGLPGVMQIFLPDGTLLMDSCWETYRIEKWQSVSENRLAWQEDTAEINTQIVELTEKTLHLRLELRADTVEQKFQVVEAPYLCPDIPK